MEKFLMQEIAAKLKSLWEDAYLEKQFFLFTEIINRQQVCEYVVLSLSDFVFPKVCPPSYWQDKFLACWNEG